MLVVGGADVVVAVVVRLVVVRLVVVGREVVVFFVVVGVLELLGVAMTAAAGCPGLVANHHTAGPRSANPMRKRQTAPSTSMPRMKMPPKTIPIIARMVFMI